MEIEAEPHELMAIEDSKELADQIKRAFDAANAVWKNHPEFKTVTLDTLSQEEKAILKQNMKNGNKGS